MNRRKVKVKGNVCWCRRTCTSPGTPSIGFMALSIGFILQVAVTWSLWCSSPTLSMLGQGSPWRWPTCSGGQLCGISWNRSAWPKVENPKQRKTNKQNNPMCSMGTPSSRLATSGRWSELVISWNCRNLSFWKVETNTESCTMMRKWFLLCWECLTTHSMNHNKMCRFLKKLTST